MAERLNIRKSDNVVIDKNQFYDPRIVDNVDGFPDGTIPEGELPQKFMRDDLGNIVRRPPEELMREYDDELKADLIAKIDALPTTLPSQLTDILKAIIRGLLK